MGFVDTILAIAISSFNASGFDDGDGFENFVRVRGFEQYAICAKFKGFKLLPLPLRHL